MRGGGRGFVTRVSGVYEGTSLIPEVTKNTAPMLAEWVVQLIVPGYKN